MNHYVAIAIGGGLGSVARFWLASSVHRYFKVAFPYGTLAVNVLGCFLLGGIVGLMEHRQMFSPGQRVFLTVGILGGFTTFRRSASRHSLCCGSSNIWRHSAMWPQTFCSASWP